MPSKNKAPKVAKTKASKKSAKPVAPVAPVEPVAPVVPVAPVEPVAPVVSLEVEPVLSELDYSDEINHLQTELKNALTLVKNLVTHVSKLEKRMARDRKAVEKKITKSPTSGGKLLESKIYENPQFSRMKDLMSKLK
mgnify:CR=1 FL=1